MTWIGLRVSQAGADLYGRAKPGGMKLMWGYVGVRKCVGMRLSKKRRQRLGDIAEWIANWRFKVRVWYDVGVSMGSQGRGGPLWLG